LKPRARQNVIFELGYFFAKLERKNVCVLYKQGVEILSDISGIVYILMDEHGAWKSKLAQEIRQAGLNINLNKI
jgi:predicted nucleotide-binding protein